MAVSTFLLVASAAVLVSGQFGQIPAPSPHAGCTESSFSIPSWLIQNVKYTDDNVTFDLHNRATNSTATLGCQKKEESGWNSCSIQGSSNMTLGAAVQVGESLASFLVKETWTCSDRGKALTFNAAGNNSAALNYTSPILVKGTLYSPVSITPAYADGPKGHDSPGCTAKSEKPSWVLSLIHFTDEPGDASTAPFQNFNLIVTNPATGYQASCMPGGSFGDTPNLSPLVCAGDEFQSVRVGLHPITTQASFDPATSLFTLNQTWFCDDTDVAKPLQINAAGSTTLPLECTTQEVNNHTNKYCTVSGDVTLPGKLGTVVTLAPYSLEDPTPQSRGDGCTLTSIFHPAWQFSDFTITGEDSVVAFEVILAAENRGFQYPIPISQGNASSEEEGFYQCEIGADGGNDLPLWPYRCRFKYTPDKKELVLKADWACQDLDEANPVHFSGVTTTTINSTLTCETVDGRSRCATADPGYTWVAGISNVTWGKLE